MRVYGVGEAGVTAFTEYGHGVCLKCAVFNFQLFNFEQTAFANDPIYLRY